MIRYGHCFGESTLYYKVNARNFKQKYLGGLCNKFTASRLEAFDISTAWL
tara:strand:- start:1539 stop:1688 length:150 start_codon:yes stop_codon:yes gene_type:complete